MQCATRGTCWWIGGLVLLIELVVLYQFQGPSPQGADAPLEEFSAERAVTMLKRILGDQAAASRGFAGERSRARSPRRGIARTGVGRRDSAEQSRDGQQVHACATSSHDCPTHRTPDDRWYCAHTMIRSTAGPGAADAGSCVAALLETARALQHGEPLRRPVYLLLTDGEEAGLKGAFVFVREHALSDAKPFVLNFDARGTSGPSLMYETHRGNLATVRWMSRSLPRPCFTGSAFVTVYRYMPNDSDFSVFCRDGWTGLNFAFIGDCTSVPHCRGHAREPRPAERTASRRECAGHCAHDCGFRRHRLTGIE